MRVTRISVAETEVLQLRRWRNEGDGFPSPRLTCSSCGEAEERQARAGLLAGEHWGDKRLTGA